nr:MAG TPA: hypothetical protein [Caudoviricetes sp.]
MIPAARRSHHQPPHRRLLFLSKTAPISFSVAFLTPPTFPAPAPRKRFFDPLPKKILGFRTRKGRPPRRQYLARARLEFRAGLRVVVSSRARAFGISCGLRPAGRWSWRRAGRSGGGWLALRLRACAAWYLCAGLRVWYLLRPPGWRRWRMAGRPANCWSWPPPCRPSARRADRRPHRSRPPRPPAAGLPICRRDRLPRRSADLPPGRPEPPPRVFTAPGIVPG